MALQFEPGNGGGVIEIEPFEAVSPKDRFDSFIDLFARDPRLDGPLDDRADLQNGRRAFEPFDRVPIPTPAPLTPAPIPTPVVIPRNEVRCLGIDCVIVVEPLPLRQTLQPLLAPILTGTGFGGGTGRALPLGTAGTRLVAAPPARSPLVTLLILAGIAGVGYYLYQRYRKGKAE